LLCVEDTMDETMMETPSFRPPPGAERVGLPRSKTARKKAGKKARGKARAVFSFGGGSSDDEEEEEDYDSYDSDDSDFYG